MVCLETYDLLIKTLVDQAKTIFRGNLVGVYLHGSMAMNCFNPRKSDIDILIVVDDNITDHTKKEFMDGIMHLNEKAPEKGIEMSIVRKNVCQPFIYPTPYVLHFSNTHTNWYIKDPWDYIKKMQGTDKDLAAHFVITQKYGIELYGEKKETVFGPVPRENYIDSICYDIEDAIDGIVSSPLYFTLNLCRVLAFLKDDLYLSKADGAKWGISNLSREYSLLLKKAMESYQSDAPFVVEKDELISFAKYMTESIAKNR